MKSFASDETGNGMSLDAAERPVIAFTDKARAEECAAKRETRQYDEYWPIWDYKGSEVKEIPLVDFGDRQEEK